MEVTRDSAKKTEMKIYLLVGFYLLVKKEVFLKCSQRNAGLRVFRLICKLRLLC